MNTLQQKEFLRFIKLLSDNDVLKDVVLIGSWAEFLYKEAGILSSEYIPNIKTMDIDFLLKNLRKPTPPKNLISLAKESGYMVDGDRLTGVTKISSNLLEIEFLIAKKGAGLETSLKTNLGVTAQALRHLDVMLNNTLEANILGFNISVPTPEAYTLHKIVINGERGKKAEKDIRAIENIFRYLDRDAFDNLKSRLTKKEQAAVNAFLETRKAMDDARNGVGMSRAFSSVSELMEDLNAGRR